MWYNTVNCDTSVTQKGLIDMDAARVLLPTDEEIEVAGQELSRLLAEAEQQDPRTMQTAKEVFAEMDLHLRL